jgi:hypothetical protein
MIGCARTTLDAVADILEGRSPVGRYRDAINEDDARELLRSKGYLILPPELKSRVELRFPDELMLTWKSAVA